LQPEHARPGYKRSPENTHPRYPPE
jgi:hypothetical protein